VEATVKSAKSL